mgnify:FL=1
MPLLTTDASNPLGTKIATETDGKSSTVNQIDDTAGIIYQVEGKNLNGANDVYLKVYAGISQAPTVGSTAPTHIYRISAGSSMSVSYPAGLSYTTGLFAAVVETSGGTEGSDDPSSAVTYSIRYTT